MVENLDNYDSSHVSHELRTPLNAVLGMLELSLEERLSDPLRDYITTAYQSAQRLLTVVDDLADLPQSGEFELAEAPFGLQDAIAEALEQLKQEAEGKELEFLVHVQPEVPSRLRGDIDRIREILTNLVRHVVEATDASAIHVEFGVASTTGRTIELSFGVADDIPSMRNWPKNLFDDTNPDQNDSNARLALVISRHWIERMGGRIWFDPDRPTCICGTVRLRRAGEARGVDSSHASEEEISVSSVAKSGQQRRRSLRVLVVDDTPSNQKVASSILTTRGHHVEVVENGRKAVDCLGHRFFDVVLMDVQMPVMDGLVAAKSIRSLADRTKAHVPIIAMTANATRDGYRRCLAAGMDSYLSKPISATTLVGHVESYASSRVVAVPAAALRRLGGDEALLQEMIRLFEDDGPSLLENIRGGLDSGDTDAVARAAHSLRSLAANFDAVPTVEAAWFIERRAREGSCRALRPALAALESELAELIEVLNGGGEHAT